jgi:oxygen-independent coproporphyrinogen-3 oxidase
MDHFALPGDELAVALGNGTLQRNFQGYSTRAGLDLVGLGMSAIGQVGNFYYQNHRALDDWASALDAGRLPIWRGHLLNRDDRIRRAVIRTLMCRGELDLREIGERFDIDAQSYFAAELERLAPLAADGLIGIGPGRLQVTPLGRLLVRAIAMQFDAYQGRETSGRAPRFSRIV